MRIWILALLLCCAASVLVVWKSSGARADDDRGLDSACALDGSASQSRSLVFAGSDDKKLCIFGYIDQSLATQVASYDLAKFDSVVLTSEGGEVSPAIEVAELIADAGLRTIVSNYCLSSCANYVFIAGRSGSVLPGAILGLHGGPIRSYEPFRQRYFDTFKRQVESYNATHPEDARDVEAEFRKKWEHAEDELDMQAALFTRLSLDLNYVYTFSDRYPSLDPEFITRRAGRSLIWVPRKSNLEHIGFEIVEYEIDDAETLQLSVDRRGLGLLLFN